MRSQIDSTSLYSSDGDRSHLRDAPTLIQRHCCLILSRRIYNPLILVYVEIVCRKEIGELIPDILLNILIKFACSLIDCKFFCLYCSRQNVVNIPCFSVYFIVRRHSSSTHNINTCFPVFGSLQLCKASHGHIAVLFDVVLGIYLNHDTLIRLPIRDEILEHDLITNLGNMRGSGVVGPGSYSIQYSLQYRISI